jgi:prepilin-type N-terminal cleavage/methylation domain-containing protein
MNISKKDNRFSQGFTLIEILVVIAIIVLIAGVTLASIKASKDKAADVDTRKTLSELALKAEGQEIAPGVIDYSKAFTAIAAPAAITELATKLKLTATDYQYVSTPTSYAIVFPLKKGGYYCVDSVSRATGKEVTGLLATTGPQDCTNANRIVPRPDGWDTLGGGGGGGGGGNQGPVITFVGGDFYDPAPDARGPGLCSPDACVTSYDYTDPHMDVYYIANLLGLAVETDPRISEYQINSKFDFPLWGFTAIDPQDGNISDRFDYDTTPTAGTTASNKAAAQAILNYLNTKNHTGYTISTNHYTCNSDYVVYNLWATDNDGNQTFKDFPVYACDIQ